MSKQIVIRTVVVLFMASSHMQAVALPREEGLKACADAMVNDIAAEREAPLKYKLDPTSTGGPIALEPFEVFHLDAVDPQGGKVVARMDCTVDKRAKVVRLTRVPLDSQDASARATAQE